jgi:hypothetical protein
VLSNVTPKRGTAIEFYEDREHSEKHTVRFGGYVSQAGKFDRVTVTVTDLASTLQTGVEVSTDDTGHFEADVDLRELAKLAGRDPDDIGGVYEAFAETFAAQTVAEARSATITVTR